MINKYVIIAIIISLIFLIILFTISNSQEKFEDTNVTTSVPKPSYWSNFFKSDTRSKCFDCDNSSNLRHGSNCIDCEIEGGRKVDPILNRVLTR